MATQTKIKLKIANRPILGPKEQLLVWRKAQGMWRKRKANLLTKELRKMRESWDRRII